MRPVETTFHIATKYDDEAQVWYVSDSDVPGLATEAPTVDELLRKLKVMVSEMLTLNEGFPPGSMARFSLTTTVKVET